VSICTIDKKQPIEYSWGMQPEGTTMTPKIQKRLAPYRIEPGCDEGGHTRYWIGCRYCDRNKRQHQFYTSRPGRQR